MPPSDAELSSPSDDRSVSMVAAHLYAVAFVVPVAALAVLAYTSVWNWASLERGIALWIDQWHALLGALVGGTLTHEILHALAWRAGGAPARAIRLGFSWRALTPYAHCDVPMTARAYRIGAATPGVVLGLVPLAGSILLGSPMLFWFGLLFTAAAGGDALILWLLRGVDPERAVADHPTRAGCLVLPLGTEAFVAT